MSIDKNFSHKAKIIKIALGTILFVVCVFYFFMTKPQELTLSVKDNHVILSFPGQESISIDCSDIKSLSLADQLDVGTYRSGINTDKFEFGIRENREFGEYILAVRLGVRKYVNIRTDKKVYVVNIENNDVTENLYKGLDEMLNGKNKN